ncbi:hypothetical protein [Georgenia muralis]|uniref:hypothetical protein n=1 Tax=Georgenia muralis TaxID=154117 RepID=UPI000F4E7B4A|nr:hypothetical protein [Georgenia muralis]
MLNRFALVPGSALNGAAYYWEPSVDGHLLRSLLKLTVDEASLDTAGLGPVGENVSVLVHSWPVGMTPDALVLLGDRPSELPDGRAAIYVCAQCGDIGCGAISAVIERTATTVVWRDFRWDDGLQYEEHDNTAITGGPFVFDPEEYDAELRRFIETFTSVRNSLPFGVITRTADTPSHRRTRRWPWSSQ